MVNMNRITIVGAGLAGSLLSVYLAKKGFKVDVYERRSDMRKSNTGGGKSINLALSTRGIHALKEAGMFDEIKNIAIPMYGRMIHALDGSTQLQPYGKDNTEYINSVSRSELNKKLMDLAETHPEVKFLFNVRCTGMDFSKNEIYFHNEEYNKPVTISAPVTIATDGSTSAVRMEMLKVPGFNFSQIYENYGYKELTITAGAKNAFQMEKNALHIWPRGAFMLIALPNLDGSFTCTLFLAYDTASGGENSFEKLKSNEQVTSFFEKNFPDVISMMPALTKVFFENPTGTLMTVKCYPWSIGGTAALLGDSAHAIVPFFGQGMNAAFEDCTYLNEIIDKYSPPFTKGGQGGSSIGNGDFIPDWQKIFSEYQQLRKPNADAIADLAQENFIEMRDLVAQPQYQLKKKIETELSRRFPEKFMPKYSMVTFHRLPYSEALSRGRIQENILNTLTENKKDISEIDWKKAKVLIAKSLSNLSPMLNNFSKT